MTAQSLSTTIPVVTQAGIRWSVKASFTAYIEKMRDGNITVFDGAIRLDDGSFFFPVQKEAAVQNSGSGTDGGLRFAGAVQFTGHGGMLALILEGLEITGEGDQSILSIADAYSPEGRLPFMTLGERESTSDGHAFVYSSPTLTEEGADLYFENYRPGTEFDALTLSIDPS
ncbi:MAG: HtaA domain-containing protein [Gulosibacter sp.]|uniref:HtaA domain-containing protein n=1 Tax=Gulosibacter sp. TaxID=2817531 RepID=UPI003F8F6410